jgi:hypothetical protein
LVNGGAIMLKTINLKSPVEIRAAGISALTEALGPIGMALFLKQFELGSGDYTKEREELVEVLSIDDIEKLIFECQEL